MTTVIARIEAALGTLEADVVGFVKDTVEPAVKAEFDAVLPQVLGLGETVLAQVWQAAGTYLATGGSAADAVASVVAQLPADLQALEHLVMAAFAGAVQSISTKPPADPQTAA
jgi:hypothetical protein